MATTATYVQTIKPVSNAGDWIGTYGSLGYFKLEGGTPTSNNSTLVYSLPSGATIFNGAANQYNYEVNSSDTRALQRAGSPTVRDSDVFYDSSFFYQHLSFADATVYRLSFFCVDWDNIGRTQTLLIRDNNTSADLASVGVSSFNGGAYVQFDVSGDLVLFCVNTGAINCVANGFFLDPVPSPSSAYPASIISMM